MPARPPEETRRLLDDVAVPAKEAEVVGVAAVLVTVVVEGGSGALVERAVADALVLVWVTGCNGIKVLVDDVAAEDTAALEDAADRADGRPGTVTCARVVSGSGCEVVPVTSGSAVGAV